MRQVFLEKGNIVLKEVCEPVLENNSVLVAVHYSFIGSSQELATIEKAKESIFFSNVPQKIKRVIKSVSRHGIEQTTTRVKGKMKGRIQPLGYSCSGEVIAVGKDVNHLKPGDLVACASASFANHADIISIPQNLIVKISKKEYLKEASIATIGAIALQSVRRANVQIGETVCVTGLGLLGQLTMQLTQLSGANTIGIDIEPKRLQLAKELGAKETYHAIEDTVLQDIEFLTDHQGVDCTIITASSKSDAIIQQAMEITRKKGKIVIIGDIGLNIERNPFYSKEIDIIASCSYGPGKCDCNAGPKENNYPYWFVRWTQKRNLQSFVNLIENKKINIEKLISYDIDISDAQVAYNKLKDRKTLGILLSYFPKSDSKSKPKEKKENKKTDGEITFKPATKDNIRVGIIGAGLFAKSNLIPIIAQQEHTKVDAVVDKNIANFMNVSKTYGAKKCFSDSNKLFEKDFVDVVVVSSLHKRHSNQALEAMKHGKAVFLEKPMATTFKELETISTFIRKNPEIPFCVDYNRSFSPFVQKIKCEVKKRKTPLVINYRMNVELLQKNYLANEEMEAGRIIGEACNIFDVFCFLTDSKPYAVSVESLNPKHSRMFPTDNFCTQISFQDGSICSLIYTSLGSQKIGRERMELFFDAKSIIMDNYKVLKGFGMRASFDECLKFPNKGRETLINRFFEELQQNNFSPPINVDRLYNVGKLTLVVDQLACNGGGNTEI